MSRGLHGPRFARIARDSAQKRAGDGPSILARSTRIASALRHISATAVRRSSSSTSRAKHGDDRVGRRFSRAETAPETRGDGDDPVVVSHVRRDDVVGESTSMTVGENEDVLDDARTVPSRGRRRRIVATKSSSSKSSSSTSSSSSRARVASRAMRRSRRRRNPSINSALASLTKRACASALARARSRACVVNDSDVSARHARIARSFARLVSTSSRDKNEDILVAVVVIERVERTREGRGRGRGRGVRRQTVARDDDDDSRARVDVEVERGRWNEG